jgi:hypothetical protein
MARYSQISSITLVSLLSSISESKDWQWVPRSVNEDIEVQGVKSGQQPGEFLTRHVNRE